MQQQRFKEWSGVRSVGLRAMRGVVLDLRIEVFNYASRQARHQPRACYTPVRRGARGSRQASLLAGGARLRILPLREWRIQVFSCPDTTQALVRHSACGLSECQAFFSGWLDSDHDSDADIDAGRTRARG